MKKDFQKWCSIKQKLHNKKIQAIYFRKKEIWWCSIGCNIGFEQDGKNAHFERPVLILWKINRYLFFGIPLSTVIKDHEYYIEYRYKDKTYAALILQARVFSSKRLSRRIGALKRKEFMKILDAFKHVLK